VRRLGLLVALALALPGGALASERHPTQREVETEIVCPVCTPQTLDQSRAPIALRMRRFIAVRIAAGDSKSEIKDKLVAQFGRRVLAAPEHKGFDLLAWMLPLAGVAVGALVLAIALRRWTRPPQPASRLDPELERRLEDELARFPG
jgi:cytochrome c-type biogenesis protein CcmH